MTSSADNSISLAKVAEYVEALTRDPKSRIFVPLSEIYRQAGMLDEAQSVAVKGIKQNPDYSLGYIALGRILVAKDMVEEAEKVFRKALRLDPENLAALKGLLRLLWDKGDFLGARKTAEAVYALKPGDGDAEKILQRLAARDENEATSGRQGEQREAAAPPESGAKPEKPEGEEPIKTATLAEIYVRQGLFEKALNVYRQILSRDPQNQEIRRKALIVKKRLEEQQVQFAQTSGPASRTVTTEEEAVAAMQTSPTGIDVSEMSESAPEPPEKTIKTLESWLDSIRQRREHVQ